MNKNKIKINVFEEEVKLELFADTYLCNKTLAINAIEEDIGESFKTVSENLPDLSYLLDDNEFFFDTNNDLFNIKDAMVKAGLIAFSKKSVDSRFGKYQVFKLLVELPKEKNMSKENSGMKLSFGTEEIGRSSVELQFNNEWLTLNIRITADKDSIYIDCKNVEESKFLGTISEEEVDGIYEINYDTIEGFNDSITPILYQFFKKYFKNEQYQDGNLSDFSFTGIRLDLD